jgi:excisionase family DNA binding protein
VLIVKTQNISKHVERNSKLLDDKQAAEYLTVSPGTLSVWRSTGRYALPFVKVGRMVRYRPADLDAWLETRSRDNGATA